MKKNILLSLVFVLTIPLAGNADVNYELCSTSGQNIRKENGEWLLDNAMAHDQKMENFSLVLFKNVSEEVQNCSINTDGSFSKIVTRADVYKITYNLGDYTPAADEMVTELVLCESSVSEPALPGACLSTSFR